MVLWQKSLSERSEQGSILTNIPRSLCQVTTMRQEITDVGNGVVAVECKRCKARGKNKHVLNIEV